MSSSRVVLGVAPAAGAEIVFTVPSSPAAIIGPLEAFYFELVTNATVATRRVRVLFDDGVNVFYACFVQVGQTNNQTYRYNVGPHGQYNFDGITNESSELLPTPPFGLRPGWRIRTLTDALQPGDQFSAPVLVVRDEWA